MGQMGKTLPWESGETGADSVGDVNEVELSGGKNFVITIHSSKNLKSTS